MLNGWWHLSQSELRALEDDIVLGRASGGPYHLELQPTNKCNAKCTFCCSEHFRFGESLSWEVLRDLVLEETERNLIYLRLAGGGEPLIYPKIKDLIGVMSTSKLRGFDVITNGITLKPLASQLIESRCEQIHVSLNEGDAENYEKTMRIPGKNFDRAIEGIRAAVAARDLRQQETGKRCLVNIQFFLNSRNWESVESMYELALDLGVDFADFRSAFPPASGNGVDLFAVEVEEQLLEKLLRIIERDANSSPSIVRIVMANHSHLNSKIVESQMRLLNPSDPRVFQFTSKAEREHYCFMPFYSGVVAATGSVFPCCVLTEQVAKKLGNISEHRMKVIWDGSGYQRLRSAMREVMINRGKMRYSPKCHGCLGEMCIPEYACLMTYNLASPEFYSQVSGRLSREIGLVERVYAQLKTASITSVHQARALQRQFVKQ